MAVYQWSKTPSNNATADPTISWAEGMSPSSVNDSSRAEMARLADWRDDISGALTTTGTGTALVLATNQVFDTTAHMNGAMIAFVPNATNTGAVTLAVDGLTAKPIRSETGSGGNLGAGVLVAGTPYVVSYYDSVGEFILQGFVGNPYAVPLGAMLDFTGDTSPNSNFVMPYGQAISRTTYATYFAMVGTTYGVGNGTTTFNVPDLRGRIAAGKDDMGGSAASRLTATYFGTSAAALGAVGGDESHTLSTAEIPSHTHTVTDPGHVHGGGDLFDAQGNGNQFGTGSFGAISVVNNTGGGNTASNTTGITNQNTGGGGAHAIVQPTIILNKILRIF